MEERLFAKPTCMQTVAHENPQPDLPGRTPQPPPTPTAPSPAATAPWPAAERAAPAADLRVAGEVEAEPARPAAGYGIVLILQLPYA